MSSAYAIAGVTAVLQGLLGQGLSDHDVIATVGTDVNVSAVPPDQVDDISQLNIFLYQITPNLGWRNECLPSRNIRSQKLTNQPLALDLHYLVSAHAEVDLFSEVILGSAMQTLHERSFFDREAVRVLLTPGGGEPLQNALIDSGLADQLEQIKITPEYLSNEDMSKLWSAIQSNFRISTAYMATVVLIEAEEPSVSPLPVLTRDITVRPNLIPPTPMLMNIEYTNQQIAGRLSETITLTGYNLNGPNVRARLQMLSAELDDDFPLLANANNERVQFSLPNNAAVWRAGVYELSLTMDDAGGIPIESNNLTLTIAPQFSAFNATRNTNNTVSVDIDVNPEVHDNQSVSMIFGQTEQIAEAITVLVTGSVSFIFPDIPAGNYWARLRVDGVDSLLIDRSATPLAFFPSQEVAVPA